MKTRDINMVMRSLVAVAAILAGLAGVASAEDKATLDQQLIEAAKRGDVGLVKSLLDKGANVNARERDGMTALVRAACRGHADVANLLLDKGCNPNARDRRGGMPLQYAASKRHFEVVKLLVENGTDVDAAERPRATAMDIAEKSGYREIVEYLNVRKEGLPHLKTWSGEVISTTPKAVGVRVHDDEAGRVIMMRLGGPGTESSLLRSVAVGATVEVTCRLEAGGKVGYMVTATGPDEARGKSEDAQWPSAEQKAVPLKTLKGKVVSSLVRTLGIQVSDGREPEVITVRVALRTKFAPFYRPRVGQEVEVKYREKDGTKFGYEVAAVGQEK